MTKNYLFKFALILFASLAFHLSLAQSASQYSFSASSGTFTPIVGGTALSGALGDDQISSSTAIGFSFVYDGATFTTFKASSNGFMSFGTGSGSIASNSSTVTAVARPLLAPLWDDLDGGRATSAVTYIVTGVSPNRIFTLEWLNHEWDYSSSSEDVSFQIKLYETSNMIEYIYRDELGSLASPDATIGLVGTSTYLSLNNSSSTPVASSTSFQDIISTSPATGQVYTFSPPSCLPVSGVAFAAISTDSADVSWSHSGTPINYVYEYGATGFSLGSGTRLVTTSTSATISGLTANTGYDVYVRAVCVVGDSSNFTGPFSFTTLCSAESTPWAENVEGFSNTTNSTIENCWSSFPTGTSAPYRWNIGTGLTVSSNTGPSGGANGSSRYFYIEASDGSSGDKAELFTPQVDLTGLTTPMLEFYTHLYGAHIDTLRVEAFDGTTWNEIYTLVGQKQSSSSDDWQLNKVLLTGYSGIVALKFVAIKGTSFEGDISIDEISVKEAPSCIEPNIATLGVTNLMPFSANVFWTETGNATSWQIEYGLTGFTQGTGSTLVVSNDTFNLTGLSSSSDYDFYVRAICGAGDSSVMVGPFSFQTLVSCPSIPGISGAYPSFDTAIASWTYGSSPLAFQYEYGVTGFVRGTGTQVLTTLTRDTISGLLPQTTYQIYIRAICAVGDSSTVTGPFSFTTGCGNEVLPYSEDFTSYIPNCWTEFTGQLGATSTTVVSATNSDWTGDGFGNVGSSGAAKMNIYDDDQYDWLVSPSIDLGSGAIPYQLEYDVALTNWNNTTSATMDADDSLAVVISIDNGVTWSQANILKVYTAGSEPSNTGDSEIILLTGYTGVIKIGFYAHSTFDISADNDVFIDNFLVREVPTCDEPLLSSLDANFITANSAIVNWTEAGTATSWQVQYGVTGFALGTGTSIIASNDTTSLSSLSDNTAYEFYVRSICGPGDSSAITGPFSFTTPCGSVIPTYTQNFTSYLPNCWTEFIGQLGATSTTVVSATNSDWTGDGFGNVGSSGAAKMNIYDDDQYDWLVSPSIDLGSGAIPYQLQYDVALTDWNNTTSATMDADDSLAVVISIDNGVTWSQANILKVYTAGSEPSNTGDSEIILLTGYTGVIKIGFYAHSTFDISADNDVFIDNFLVREVPTCPEPLLSSLDANSITAISAVINWTEAGTATSWQVQYGPTGFALGSGTSFIASNDTVSISPLMATTAYDFYVRAICGVGDSSTFTGPFSFTTPVSCPSISTVSRATPSSDSAIISWTYAGTPLEYLYEYGTSGFTLGSGTTVTTTATTDTITGLVANTTYQMYLRVICAVGDSSIVTGPFSFTTPCGSEIPTYTQDFSSFPGDCWTEFRGVLGATSTTVVSATSSDWTSDGFGNVGSSGAARMNIYNTGQNEWLVSPSIDLGTGAIPYQLEYDVALTQWVGTASDAMDADDSLAVVISTDNGVTWSQANILKVYTAGSEPSNTGDAEFISLVGYTGVIKIGFYASSSLNLVVDNSVYIDNFVITDRCTNSTDAVTETQCAAYTSPSGKIFTTSGTYLDTIQNTTGCDSIITINLIINNSFDTISPIVCDTYTAPSGAMYTSTGMYMDTIANSIGCDSIISINLTVNNSIAVIDNIDTCDSYTLPDGVVTQISGVFVDTIPSHLGCDSIITSIVTINYTTSSTISAIACGSYTSPSGKVWVTSGTRFDTIANLGGCDSLMTITITIKAPSSESRTISSCNTYTVPETGSVYTTSGTYTDVTTNAFGCPHTITTILTINSATAGTVNVSGITLTSSATGVTYKWMDCNNGYSYLLGQTAQTFTPERNGNYAVEVKSTNGCKDTTTCTAIMSVSLDEYEVSASDISIYPNPSNNIITVDIAKLNANENVSVKLFDAVGKLVYSKEISSVANKVTFDVTDLAEGIYSVSVSNDFFVTTKKVTVIN